MPNLSTSLPSVKLTILPPQKPMQLTPHPNQPSSIPNRLHFEKNIPSSIKPPSSHSTQQPRTRLRNQRYKTMSLRSRQARIRQFGTSTRHRACDRHDETQTGWWTWRARVYTVAVMQQHPKGAAVALCGRSRGRDGALAVWGRQRGLTRLWRRFG